MQEISPLSFYCIFLQVISRKFLHLAYCHYVLLRVSLSFQPAVRFHQRTKTPKQYCCSKYQFILSREWIKCAPQLIPLSIDQSTGWRFHISSLKANPSRQSLFFLPPSSLEHSLKRVSRCKSLERFFKKKDEVIPPLSPTLISLGDFRFGRYIQGAAGYIVCWGSKVNVRFLAQVSARKKKRSKRAKDFFLPWR